MLKVEQVDHRDVFPFHNRHIQFFQETADGDPEIVADHHDCLNCGPIALQQGLRERSFGIILLREQPLLELVENQQQFAATRNQSPPPDAAQDVLQRIAFCVGDRLSNGSH